VDSLVLATFEYYVQGSETGFSRRQALTGLALNVATTLAGGYAGKVLGGWLSSTSADEVSEAWKFLPKNFNKDFRSYPYLRTGDIGENARKGFDYVSTSHLLINNAIWSVAGCYGSLSSPCD